MSIEHFLEESRRRERYRELEPLRDLTNNDPLLKRIADLYVYGEILTLTECLMQMVKHTAQDSLRHRKTMVELMQARGIPSIGLVDP